MIIDIHAHTTNHTLWGLHVDKARIEDLERMAELYGISLIVLMATYFPFKKTGLSNLELLERIKERKLFKVFGSLDAMNNLSEGIEELRILANEGKLSGLKIYPGYQDFQPSSEKLFPVYALAEQFNLPIAIHSGELHHCCDQKTRALLKNRCGEDCHIDKLGHLAKPEMMELAIQMFPKANFILAHLANPYFSELRQLMLKYPNIYTDISGQFLSGTDEDTPSYRTLLQKEIAKFLKLPNGINRIMFGTDFPIQSYQDSLEIISLLKLKQLDEEKILFRNALNTPNLKEKDPRKIFLLLPDQRPSVLTKCESLTTSSTAKPVPRLHSTLPKWNVMSPCSPADPFCFPVARLVSEL